MRKYQAIWEAIKENGKASLIAEASLHERIVHAVRKEKNIDLGWKLLSAELGKKYYLYDKSEGATLYFTLVTSREKELNL